MTAAQFRIAREALRYSTHGLAAALGCARSLVIRWEAGEAEAPAEVAAWLARRLRSEASDPPPQGWQQRTGRRAA